MTTQQFLENRLNKRKTYSLTPKDERKIKQNIELFILDRLTSGSYRKSKLDEATLENLKRKIKEAVSANKPLQFTFPFGGYKLHSFPSAPTVGWAEFFTIAYYSDYLNQVTDHYEPGVEFTFSSDEAIINKMDNIPQTDIDMYTDTFKGLLNAFNKVNPKNMKFKLQRVKDLYASETELWDELESYRAETENNWENFSEDKRDKRKKMILLNFNFKGEKDLTELSEQELEELLKENVRLHDSYLKLTKRRDFVRGEDKIVVFSTSISDSITLGSTKYSGAKFWSGYGALKLVEDNKYSDVVLTPEQIKGVDFKEEKIDLIDLPNFDKIRIYPQNKVK